MDYQIVFRNHFMIFLLLIFSFVHCAFNIVNRDIILTPKQGLQLSGKRIFYDETTSSDANIHNDASVAAARPWERTLKHVTYLTLFTNAAGGIITGNYSKVKEYNDFLQSPYVRSQIPNDSRFGDIVTLAQGRLDAMANGTYSFVEGNCDYDCARDNNMIAMWHVQKIRHRDVDRKFHYEMKFSVSPITQTTTPSETVVRGGPNKRTIMDNSYYKGLQQQQQHHNVQTFIQKEDDYPLSFSKILTGGDDSDFADRRYDAARNFRQVTNQQHSHVTPMPQPTFLRGVYRTPPAKMAHGHGPALPEHLNIGEYYNKGSYVLPPPKASSKIELFPNLLTMMFGKPPKYSTPHSTYRPHSSHHMKFPRPEVYSQQTPSLHHHAEVYTPQRTEVYAPHRTEVYTPQRQETYTPQRPEIYTPQPSPLHYHADYPKFPEYYHSQEQQFTPKVPQTAVVAHHYHHHYFMPNASESAEITAGGHSGEQQIPNPADFYKNVQVHEESTPLPQFGGQVYEKSTYDEQLLQQHHHQQEQQQQLQHQQQQKQQQESLHQLHQQQQQSLHPLHQQEHEKSTFDEQLLQQHRHHHQEQQQQQPEQPSLHQLQQQEQQQQVSKMPPAPQKFIFPTTQIEQHRVIHVTPVPPLRKPQYQHYYQQSSKDIQPQYASGHGPYAIYPAPVQKHRSDVSPPPNKPFVHSQPLDEVTIRYSEPDPLYAHINENDENTNSYGSQQEQEGNSNEPQLELPQDYGHHIEPNDEASEDNVNEQSDSIEAQVQAPNSNANTIPSYDQSVQQSTTKTQQKSKQIKQKASHSSLKFSTEKTTDNTIETEASNTITLAVTIKPKPIAARPKRVRLKVTKLLVSTTSKPKVFSTKVTTDKPTSSTNAITSTRSTTTTTTTSTTVKPHKQFVSTSTTESPLKSVSRHRNSNRRLTTSTTTTEKPVLKWKPRRKEATGKALNLKQAIQQLQTFGNKDNDTKTLPSIKEVTNFTISTTERQPEQTTQMSNDITTSASTTLPSLLVSSSSTQTPPTPSTTASDMDAFEVLTQKSVSKSVKFTTSDNGQEIPIIINESVNEVKTN